MALRKLLESVMRETKLPISDDDFLYYYNKSLRKLAMLHPTARKVIEKDVTSENSDTWYDFAVLADNVIGVRRVVDDEGFYFSRYQMRDGTSIKLDCAGSYTIMLEASHSEAATMEAIETISPYYNDAIVLYISAECTSKSSPEAAAYMMNQFQVEAAKSNQELRKVRNKASSVYAPAWR